MLRRRAGGRALYVARVCAITAGFFSLLTLIGYAVGIPVLVHIWAGFQGMSPLTAAGLLALAASGLAATYRRLAWVVAGAAVAGTVAVVTLASHAVLGADEASLWVGTRFFHMPMQQTGRTSVATGAGLILVAIGLLARRHSSRIADVAASLALLVSGMALLGYLYGVADLYALPMFNSMALNTAAALFLLSITALFAVPGLGWAAILGSRALGGTGARRQIAFILLPILTGWGLCDAARHGRFGPAAGMALLVISTIVPLAILVLRDGHVLNVLERERRERAGVQERLAQDMERQLAAQATQLKHEGEERAKAETETLRKTADEEIHALAFYDPLTGLPNRRLLHERLRNAFTASAQAGRRGALMLIDLDHFKILNDTLGHDFGDLLLQKVAERLTGCVRKEDTVARLGGDEFVVVLEDLDSEIDIATRQAEGVGKKILKTLGMPYLLSEHMHHSTPSIGAAMFLEHQASIEDLLKRADVAMYDAKATGRNALKFFSPSMQAAIAARAEMETDLRIGIAQGQLLLYYQPQMDGTDRLTGAEALVRWLHPERGLVGPADFISLAEETGLILPLGLWVLDTACRQLESWAHHAATRSLMMSVNVSARQFGQDDFVVQVLGVLRDTGADPRKLKMELTESLLLTNPDDVILKMERLKSLGISFSLDDFGTGYSSLSYLKRLPLSQLKIDRSFVRDLLVDPNVATIARTIIALAHSLGLTVIAEGVEKEEQRAFLIENGCSAYQGFLTAPPLPAREFERLLLQLIIA